MIDIHELPVMLVKRVKEVECFKDDMVGSILIVMAM